MNPRCCTHYPLQPDRPHGPHHVCHDTPRHHGRPHECICGHTWTTTPAPAIA